MAWTIEYTATALKDLQRLDRGQARRLHGFLTHRIAASDDPRRLGRRLSGPLGEFWRYRVGSYRVIVEIEDDVLRVLVIRIGHRREAYGHAP